jgi:23S rRNA G2445 N2-methylase RlmL
MMTDIGLDLRTSGRAAKPIKAELGRPLTEVDLKELEMERGVTAPGITKLRESHHQLARVIANGAKPSVAALVTGYSISRISILLADPAFRDLVATYRGVKDVNFADYQTKAGILSVEAVEVLQERLHEAPDGFSNDMLVEIGTKFADRTGNGPASKSTNVNVNVDLAARIEAGRKRAGLTIEHEPSEASSSDGESVA